MQLIPDTRYDQETPRGPGQVKGEGRGAKGICTNRMKARLIARLDHSCERACSRICPDESHDETRGTAGDLSQTCVYQIMAVSRLPYALAAVLTLLPGGYTQGSRDRTLLYTHHLSMEGSVAGFVRLFAQH